MHAKSGSAAINWLEFRSDEYIGGHLAKLMRFQDNAKYMDNWKNIFVEADAGQKKLWIMHFLLVVWLFLSDDVIMTSHTVNNRRNSGQRQNNGRNSASKRARSSF